jgi:chromodomain protein Y
VDTKVVNREWKYLIAWKGYGSKDNTWEPEQNLKDCKDLLKEFKEKHMRKSKSGSRGG